MIDCFQSLGLALRVVIPLWRKLDQMSLPHTTNSSTNQMALTPPKSKTPLSQDSTIPPSRLPLPCSHVPSSSARQANHSGLGPNGTVRGVADFSWVEYGIVPGSSAAKSVPHKINTQLPHSQAHMLTQTQQKHTCAHTSQMPMLSASVTDSSRTRSPGREEVNRLFGCERRYD